MKGRYDTLIQPRLEQIGLWTRQGASVKELARRLGVAYSTLRKYLDAAQRGDERYAELWRTWEQAKAEPDRAVEAALFRRATGYSVTRTAEKTRLDKDGQVVEIISETTVLDVPPDTAAAMFWLANNKRSRWSYRPEETPQTAQGGVVELPAVMEDGGGGNPHPAAPGAPF